MFDAIKLLCKTRRCFALPSLIQVACNCAAKSERRGTLSVSLKGTKPMTGNCSEPSCGHVFCNSAVNFTVSLISLKFGSRVTGICAESLGKPRVRMKSTPTFRAADEPPKLRTCDSTFSAVCAGRSISALLIKITFASRACASDTFKSLENVSRAVGTKPSTIIMSCALAI